MLFLKDEVEQREIDRDDEHEHEDGRDEPADAAPQEKVEQDDVQRVIDEMAETEPHGFLGRRSCAEGEVRGQHEVDGEGGEIADGVGDVHFHYFLAEIVHDIVDACRDGSYNGKTQKLVCLRVIFQSDDQLFHGLRHNF